MKVRSSIFASTILILEVVGVALFLRGFFPVPVKSSLPSKNKLSDLPPEPLTGESSITGLARASPRIHRVVPITGGPSNASGTPKPLFKRVVIMLVDALREDFVFGPNGRMFMPYTRHVIERGSSLSYVAKARPPTVTMPRIKVRAQEETTIN